MKNTEKPAVEVITPAQVSAAAGHDMMGLFANIWVRQKRFTRKGQMIGGHKHDYDHMSLLAEGSVKVIADGNERIFHAPAFLIVRKDVIHDVEALTDNVSWFCLFANRDADGNVYDPKSNDPLFHAGYSAGRVGSLERAKRFSIDV